MKNISFASFASTLLIFGCGELLIPFGPVGPTLRNQYIPALSASKLTPCTFSTQTKTTLIPKEAWYFPHYLAPREKDHKVFLDLESSSVPSGDSYWHTSKMPNSYALSARQQEICDQLENEFRGYDDPFYRRHSYIERFSLAEIKRVTKNNTNLFFPIHPQKCEFILEYADPRSNKEAVVTQSIPISIGCDEVARVNSNTFRDNFKFKHGKKCEFRALDHKYRLNTGETVKLSLRGSIEETSNGENYLLSIKEVSWRDW